MLARHGAQYTGVDLTRTAVEATRRHFEVVRLAGTFRIDNAERLTFPDASFDMVYSLGVLHHTPNPDRAFREVHRVLKPGGRAVIMLYHRNSFNYHVRILGMMRAKLLWRILSRVGRWKADRERFANEALPILHGNDDRRAWDIHYRNFLERGWSYLRAENFVHRCTDGPDCPIAFTYSRHSARAAFSHFREIDFAVAHFPIRQHLGNWFPQAAERFLAKRMGWCLLVYATK
jgi:SAM-dependent methyltransferase